MFLVSLTLKLLACKVWKLDPPGALPFLTRALKCKPSAQIIMRDDREVYCIYQVVDVYISGIVKSLSINYNVLYINFEVSHVECVK